ncbi:MULTISPECIES: S-layer homology domain-containing protein [unclassified Sporosarcina]|uniref:S-layer homology domain-containing protein n=1 Tax=unclassified Sporosarcina TaxID=2647733 RepID=UPI001303F6AE|nr:MULTISPECIES: S-layer homology domain-containing protein [unclassified Sporosarcina]
MKNKFKVCLGALLLAASLPITSAAAEKQPFPDVPPSKHFAVAVNDLAARHIIGGYPDGTFKPGNSITRGQAAAIIAKMTGVDTNQVKNPRFKDVSTSHGFYKAISALAEKGVIGGYQDGTFKPNDPINRKNMAAILVKAFDLPRDTAVSNPFKDPSGITDDVLIIYKLGITTGTSPTTFSPNAFITRGQAAKMLKSTEDLKPQNILTMQPDDFGLTAIDRIRTNSLHQDVVKSILVKGKEGYSKDKIQFVPVKEGRDGIIVSGQNSDNSVQMKYYVDVIKVNGELKVSLTETDDIFSAKVKLYNKNEIKKVALSTMEGELLSDNTSFVIEKENVEFQINKAGEYIATVTYKDGTNQRYGIRVQPTKDNFEYKIETLAEKRMAEIEIGKDFNIGTHTIVGENYEEIATVTHESKTNTFRATGKKHGNVAVSFENIIYRIGECEGLGYGECYPYYVEGILIEVRQLGSIVHVYISVIGQSDHA